MTFGEVVRQHRKKRGWNQAEMAKEIGVAQATLSRWESSGSVPDLAVALRLAQVLEVPPESLLDHVIDQSPSGSSGNGRAKVLEVPLDIDPDLLTLWRELSSESRRALVQIAKVLAKQAT